MPKVGFTANNNNRLEIKGCRIKEVDFIPEQEMSSIENTRTILDPDTGAVIGIEKNIVHTVTIKLIPEKADDNNADEKPSSKGIPLGKQPKSGKGIREENTEG